MVVPGGALAAAAAVVVVVVDYLASTTCTIRSQSNCHSPGSPSSSPCQDSPRPAPRCGDLRHLISSQMRESGRMQLITQKIGSRRSDRLYAKEGWVAAHRGRSARVWRRRSSSVRQAGRVGAVLVVVEALADTGSRDACTIAPLVAVAYHHSWPWLRDHGCCWTRSSSQGRPWGSSSYKR